GRQYCKSKSRNGAIAEIPTTKRVRHISTHRPYHRRSTRSPKRTSASFSSAGDHIDLSNAHLPAYGSKDPVFEARSLFDARAAAAVSAAVALEGGDGRGPVRIWPAVEWWGGRAQSPLFE